jgi:hypothetical protein
MEKNFELRPRDQLGLDVPDSTHMTLIQTFVLNLSSNNRYSGFGLVPVILDFPYISEELTDKSN